MLLVKKFNKILSNAARRKRRKGLDREASKKAYAAFSNCLSKGAGKQGWVRSSLGKYRWQEGS